MKLYIIVMVYGIQEVCVFIHFVIVIYVTAWNDGWMVKALGCGREIEDSNPILNMLWS
jgi:hypothetical protein